MTMDELASCTRKTQYFHGYTGRNKPHEDKTEHGAYWNSNSQWSVISVYMRTVFPTDTAHLLICTHPQQEEWTSDLSKNMKKKSSHYVPLTEVFAFNTCLISRNLIFFSLIAHFLTALAYNNDKSLFRGRNAKIGYFISNTNLSQALKWCKAKSNRPMLKILQHHTVLFCESTQAVSVVVLVPKRKEMPNCSKNNRASGKHEWEGVDSLADWKPGRLLRHPSPFISD